MKLLIAAIGVTGFLLALMAVSEAQAGSIWCPPPIPGVLSKLCYCKTLTGRAEVRTPSKLPPLALIGLWRDLGQEARTNWSGQVVAEEGRRKVLSHRWRRTCDREHGCEVSKKVVGRSTVYVYGCYAKARPTSLLCRGDICW